MSGRVVVVCRLPDPLPQRGGNLQVVALVASEVEEGAMPGEREVGLDAARTDGLATLAVQVAPQRRCRRCGLRYHERVGLCWQQTRRRGAHPIRAGAGRNQIDEAVGAGVPLGEAVAGGHASEAAAVEGDATAKCVAHISPLVLDADAEPAASSVVGGGGADGDYPLWSVGDNPHGRRRHCDRDRGAGPVDGHTKLEVRVGEGLRIAARSAAVARAEDQRDAVVLLQPAIEDVDHHPGAERAWVALLLEADAKRGSAVDPYHGVVGGGRIVELRRGPVAGVAPREADRAAVVDAARADVVDDRPGARLCRPHRRPGLNLRPTQLRAVSPFVSHGGRRPAYRPAMPPSTWRRRRLRRYAVGSYIHGRHPIDRGYA